MITLFKVFMSPEASTKVSTTLGSGYIAQGPKVDEFETQLQNYLNVSSIVTVNSATSGLTLAFRLLDLQAGDEVVCSPLTCFATVAPLLTNHPNVRIRWVDIDPTTCNIDMNDLEAKISDKTKAILFVHWGGSPVDLKEVQRIREQAETTFSTRIHVIEDCAHAFGSEYQGQKIGSHGNICVFSTQAIKHLTTGDGGFLCLPTDEMFQRARRLRWYGIDRDAQRNVRLVSEIKEAGYKFHMNDIAASIGLANLPYIDRNLDYARQLANYYDSELAHIVGVQSVRPPVNSVSAYWLYTIRIIDRDNFVNYMKDKDVQVNQVHSRLDQYECTKEFSEELPQLDIFQREMVCIPIGWWVTREQATFIVDAIRTWCQQLTVRPLTTSLADNQGYSELMIQLNNHVLPVDEEQWKIRLEQVTAQKGLISVIEYKGQLIATVKTLVEYKFDRDVIHIEDVVVHRDWRHYGLGTMLLKQCIALAEKHNCYKIILNARTNVSSFYEQMGFQHEENEYVYRL